MVASSKALAAESKEAAWPEQARTWLLAHGELFLVMAFGLGLTLVYLWAVDVVALPYDDSYISLHFARNLAEHGYFTFDGETASAGATSPLHVVSLAIPIKLGAEPIWTSVVEGIVFQMLLIGATYWLAWSIFKDRWTAIIASGSVGIMGYLVLDALNGMETTLFLAVTAATAAAFFDARTWRGYLAAGLLAGASVLTRPEGFLLLGAMGLYYLVFNVDTRLRLNMEDVRRLVLLALPSVVALVGLSIFYWATTGEITPGTATAKMRFFREFELSHVQRFDLAQNGLASFLGPILPWLGFAAFAVRRREAVLFAIFWVAFMVFYYYLLPGGLNHYWFRYQHVFLPPVAVFGAAGIVSLVRGRTWEPATLALAGAVGIFFAGMVALQYENFRYTYDFEIDLAEGRQVVMAKYLRDEVPPGVAIATHDIGAIAYFSEREVIDLVGLVNPDVVDYHEGRRLREYVDEEEPGYLVILDDWEPLFLRLGVREDPALFEEVRVFSGGRSGPFTVYRTHYQP